MFYFKPFSIFPLKSAVILSLMLVLIACDDQPKNHVTTLVEQYQQQSAHLNRGMNVEAQWNPHFLNDERQQALLRDLLEGLTIYATDGGVVAGAAESWQTTDNKYWTFILRENAKWSTGEPVKAAHFVQSWQRLALSGSPLASYLTFLNLENAQEVIDGKLEATKLGVEAIDDRILTLRLEKATPQLPEMLAHISLLPEYEGRSNGAYQLKTQQDNRIFLEKNPHYWQNEQVYFDEVVYQRHDESVSSTQLDIILDGADKQIARVYLPQLCIYYYEFNQKHPKFAKSGVRKALVSMISVSNVVQTDAPAMQPTMHVLPQSLQPESENRWEPVVVEDLLQKAGINETKRLSFRLTYNQEDPHPQIAKHLIQMWSQSDLIQVQPQEVSWQQLLAQRATGDFDLIRSGWCADYHEPMAFLMNFHSKSPDNKMGFSNSEVDQLLEKTLAVISPQERTALYAQITYLLQKEAVVLPLFQYKKAVYIAPNLQGVDPKNPTGVIYSKDVRRQ